MSIEENKRRPGPGDVRKIPEARHARSSDKCRQQKPEYAESGVDRPTVQPRHAAGASVKTDGYAPRSAQPRHAAAGNVHTEKQPVRRETQPRHASVKTAYMEVQSVRAAVQSNRAPASDVRGEGQRVRSAQPRHASTKPVNAGAQPVRTAAQHCHASAKTVSAEKTTVRQAAKPRPSTVKNAHAGKNRPAAKRAKRPTGKKTRRTSRRAVFAKRLQALKKRFIKWQSRLQRRYPSLGFYVRIMWGFIFLLVILAAMYAMFGENTDRTEQPVVTVPVIATPEPVFTPEPTATPEATATPVPTPTPEPVYIDGIPEEYFYQTAKAGASYSNNSKNKLITSTKVYVGSKRDKEYEREDEIHMVPSVQYTQLEGVTTFRGSNYRENSAYGTIPDNPTKLTIEWSQRIGELDGWSGVGWTGQASAVRWPEELRRNMNITSAKKDKDGLIECIYATLDGNIYFFDMEDGKATRKPIDIGAPIKGSVTIDPRGYPLLYCGQGIYDVNGERKKCGTRIWSLYDQSLLHTVYGNDDFAVRGWRAFDCAPLVDAATDTLIQAGENGVLYTLKLNTKLTDDKISIDPETVRYVYNHSLKGQVGTENSIACYNNYVYFANNSGVIQCVDMNTMKLVWSVNAKDDIDATMAIEVEESGLVALYATNEVDNRGKSGRSQMFKINALTGELIWYVDSDRIYQHNDNGGGSFASPAIGKNDLSDLVYFHVCRTVDSGAMLYALDKQSGDIVWKKSMGKYGWCSPVCVYTKSGRGYVLVGSSDGRLRLFDGLSGKTVASANLSTNIEATPVVFDDMVVIGTRGEKIFGLKIS